MRFVRPAAALALCLAVLLPIAGAGAAPVPPHTPVGHWEGEISVPGTPLGIRIDLARNDTTGAWSGTIDIPAQSAMGLPLNDVSVGDTTISFTISDIPGDPTFHGRLANGAIEGSFSQNGMTFPFHLRRGEQPPPPRPQEPRPPFPYTVRDVTYPGPAGTLAGTLTLPAGAGPFPAVLLISGSGPQDRDETVFEHKPFLVLADHLTRAGIAVLRVDDRGVGGSTGDRREATTADYADDVSAGLDFLAGLDEIDHHATGLLGHSEGGLVAPLVAARDDRVAFVVLLAPPGVPGDELLLRQIESIARADGTDSTALAPLLDAQTVVLSAVRRGAPADSLRPPLHRLVAAQMPPETPPNVLEHAVTAQLRQVTSPWFRWFVTHDPRPVLRRVRVPVLALWGKKDLQVPPAQNLPAVAAALRDGGNPDATVKVLPGLNHLFQAARTGSPSEYHEIAETMNPAALQVITDWILAHVRRAGGGSGR